MSIRSLLHCAEWPRLHACVVPPLPPDEWSCHEVSESLSFYCFTAVTLLAFSNTAFAQRGLERALEAQRVHNPNFFQVDGVVATGISVDRAGNAVIKVYTANAGTKVPAFANGVAVKKFVAGPITAWDRPVDQLKNAWARWWWRRWRRRCWRNKSTNSLSSTSSDWCIDRNLSAQCCQRLLCRNFRVSAPKAVTGSDIF